jgi:hypothetical protein
MNKKLVLAGLLAISVIALGTASFAGAQITYYLYPINYKVTKYVVVWYFKTTTDLLYGPFDGRTVMKSTVIAYAMDANGNYLPVKPPFLIVTTKDYVILFFLSSALPAHNPDGSSCVTGSLKSGDSFTASGPGWVWSNPG